MRCGESQIHLKSACEHEWAKFAIQEILLICQRKHYHCADGQSLEERLIKLVAKGCILGETENLAGEGPEQPD